MQSVGKVVWSRVEIPGQDARRDARAGFGIQFMGGRPDQLRELEQILRQSSRRRRGSVESTPRGSHSTV